MRVSPATRVDFFNIMGYDSLLLLVCKNFHAKLVDSYGAFIFCHTRRLCLYPGCRCQEVRTAREQRDVSIYFFNCHFPAFYR